MAKTKIYDAIIVGSGATGGWAAKLLAEAGLDILVLEAGRKTDPAKEYNMLAWPYELERRGFGDRTELERTQPIQSKCYACNEYSADREWDCGDCGAHHQRDLNAARNIRAEGYRILVAAGKSETINARGADVRPATAGSLR